MLEALGAFVHRRRHLVLVAAGLFFAVSLALLLRHQLRPGPRYLFAAPEAVEGAMPGSEVDWQLRIDYAQHTGSALIRWLSGVGTVHGT